MQIIQPGLKYSSFHNDGMLSYLTGLGTSLDKTEYLKYRSDARYFSRQARNEIYQDNEIFSVIIDKVVDDSIRNWIDINHEKSEQIMSRLEQLLAKKHMTFAAKMERLDDGAAIYMDIDDGQSPDMPLNYAAIKKVNGLTVWQRWYLQPIGMTFTAQPTHWQISGSKNGKIHASRLLIYEGDSVAQDARIENNGWGSSVACKVRKAVLGYCTGTQGTANIIQELTTDVYSIENLNQMSRNSGKHAEQDMEAFRQKMQFMNMAKGMIGAVLIDKNEQYEKRVINLSGVDTIYTALSERVATASRYPYGKIFSQYKGNALSSSADAQDKDYNEMMCSYQSDRLLDNVKKLVKVVKAEPEIGIPEQEQVPVKFCPPTAENPKEQAERRYKQAQTDKIYYDMGLPGWKILSDRFGNPDTSMSTHLTQADINMIKSQETQRLSFGLDLNPFAGGQ